MELAGHAPIWVVHLDRFFRAVNQSTRSHNNTVVIRAIMVRNLALKYSRHISGGAKDRRVILARTYVPRTRVLDVHLTRRMGIAEKRAGQDRDRIFFVVDVRQVAIVRRVDVIRERGVAYLRHAVGDCAHARARWQVQREVD